MKIWKHLFEGIKLAALFGTEAPVVWRMSEHGHEQVQRVPELATGISR